MSATITFDLLAFVGAVALRGRTGGEILVVPYRLLVAFVTVIAVVKALLERLVELCEGVLLCGLIDTKVWV